MSRTQNSQSPAPGHDAQAMLQDIANFGSATAAQPVFPLQPAYGSNVFRTGHAQALTSYTNPARYHQAPFSSSSSLMTLPPAPAATHGHAPGLSHLQLPLPVGMRARAPPLTATDEDVISRIIADQSRQVQQENAVHRRPIQPQPELPPIIAPQTHAHNVPASLNQGQQLLPPRPSLNDPFRLLASRLDHPHHHSATSTAQHPSVAPVVLNPYTRARIAQLVAEQSHEIAREENPARGAVQQPHSSSAAVGNQAQIENILNYQANRPRAGSSTNNIAQTGILGPHYFAMGHQEGSPSARELSLRQRRWYT